MAGKTALAALILLAAQPAWAQRQTGGSGDPTVKPAGDPHGAIKSMSQASELGSKPDHTTTTVPDVVPSTDGAPESRRAK